jgi:hypothetical protein
MMEVIGAHLLMVFTLEKAVSAHLISQPVRTPFASRISFRASFSPGRCLKHCPLEVPNEESPPRSVRAQILPMAIIIVRLILKRMSAAPQP